MREERRNQRSVPMVAGAANRLDLVREATASVVTSVVSKEES